MVSQTGRYALHLLGALAARPGERLRGEELAALTGIPANYLSKILNQLRKVGLVESRKGWGGGFSVPDAALDRPIGDVLEAIEGSGAMVRNDCLFGLPRCDASSPCALHHHWAGIREGFVAMLAHTTIRDLAAGAR